LLGRRCTSNHLQVQNIEAVRKNGIFTVRSSYAIQLLRLEAKDPSSSQRKRLISNNHGNKTEPTSAIEKSKYFNCMDEAYSLICMSISPTLLFHIESSTTPNKVWTTLEGLFGKQDEMCGHMLEIELNSLDPSNFENIQDFFTKFKSLLLQLKGCRINKSKQEKQLILSILSKLGLEYAVFVSTFHTVRITSGAAWTMPTLDVF
jgi:hypothetical protein